VIFQSTILRTEDTRIPNCFIKEVEIFLLVVFLLLLLDHWISSPIRTDCLYLPLCNCTTKHLTIYFLLPCTLGLPEFLNCVLSTEVTHLYSPSNALHILSLAGKLQSLPSSVVPSEDPLELLSYSARQYCRYMFCSRVCLQLRRGLSVVRQYPIPSKAFIRDGTICDERGKPL
jgi:hypothetical protein